MLDRIGWWLTQLSFPTFMSMIGIITNVNTLADSVLQSPICGAPGKHSGKIQGRVQQRGSHDCGIQRHSSGSVENSGGSQVEQHADEGVVQDADVKEHLPHHQNHVSILAFNIFDLILFVFLGVRPCEPLINLMSPPAFSQADIMSMSNPSASRDLAKDFSSPHKDREIRPGKQIWSANPQRQCTFGCCARCNSALNSELFIH